MNLIKLVFKTSQKLQLYRRITVYWFQDSHKSPFYMEHHVLYRMIHFRKHAFLCTEWTRKCGKRGSLYFYSISVEFLHLILPYYLQKVIFLQFKWHLFSSYIWQVNVFIQNNYNIYILDATITSSINLKISHA